jgi:hypothetical protein
MKAPPPITDALCQLGIVNEPSREMIEKCEEFYCMLPSSNDISATDASNLRWNKFKRLSPNQGVEKLPPTSGAWKQHTRRAHLQANIWAQDLVLNPEIPDPCKLGWTKEGAVAGLEGGARSARPLFWRQI